MPDFAQPRAEVQGCEGRCSVKGELHVMYLIKQLPIQLAEGALKSLVEGAQVEIFFDLAQEILKIEI